MNSTLLTASGPRMLLGAAACEQLALRRNSPGAISAVWSRDAGCRSESLGQMVPGTLRLPGLT